MENVVQPDGPQMTISYGAFPLQAGWRKLHTLGICNAYWFSMAKMVT